MTATCAADETPFTDGAVVEMNGGQIARPAADSRLSLGLSAKNRYRARPFAPTSALPTGVCAIEIAEPLATAADARFWAPPLLAAITDTIATIATRTMTNGNRLLFMEVLLISGRRAHVRDASQ